MSRSTRTIALLWREWWDENGEWIEVFRVRGDNAAGAVGVGVGFISGKQRVDQSTPYSFTVWRLPLTRPVAVPVTGICMASP